MDSLKKLNELFNSREVGIAILNIGELDSFFYKMNDTLKKYLQYDEDEINTLSLQDITHTDDLIMTMEYGTKILHQTISEYTYKKRYIRKDKSILWGLTTVTRISDSFLLFVVQDISHYKDIQNNIHKIIEPLSNENIDDYCKRIKKTKEYKDYMQQRKYFRFTLPFPICTKLHLSQIINGSKTGFDIDNICIINISGGGLCFLSDRDIPVDESFHAYTKFKFLGETLKLTGKIIRSRAVGNKYEYGMELEINELDRDELIRLLHNLSILTKNRITIQDTDFCKKKCKK